MPEILTESFCERCGTRYTFEAAAPKGKRLGKLKVISKGFVNFVSNDESSLDEALADARSDEQRELTGRQLDAFHQTFQFCLSCRQYTCANCWNTTENRCLSCAPLLGQDVLGAPFPALDPMAGIGFSLPSNGTAEATDDNGHDERAEAAWPAADVAPPASPASSADATLEFPGLAAGAETPEAVDLAAPIAGVEAPEAPEAIKAEPVDEDVARAVAEAELARLAHDRAEAEAERARQAEAAAAAERAHAAELAAEAELARQAQAAADAEAERLRQALADAEAEQARQAEEQAEQLRQAAARAEAEQALRAKELEEAERLRRAVAAHADAEEALLAEELEGAERLRRAAAADEVERLRLAAEVEAELVRQARAEAEAERLRQAQADIEWARAVAEADRLQRVAAEAEAERALQAQAEADAKAERAHQAAEAAEAEAEAERLRQAAAEADRDREAAARAAARAKRTDDRVGPPIWQITAPESPGSEPGPLDVPPAILAPQPAVPARPSANRGVTPTTPPQWPMPAAGAPPQWPAGQAVVAASGTAGLWAASSENVISKPGPTGVQACLSCGLPLSASARFCRRCGTQQH
jgi:hypothetical protein